MLEEYNSDGKIRWGSMFDDQGHRPSSRRNFGLAMLGALLHVSFDFFQRHA
jgi:hypothetical protein